MTIIKTLRLKNGLKFSLLSVVIMRYALATMPINNDEGIEVPRNEKIIFNQITLHEENLNEVWMKSSQLILDGKVQFNNIPVFPGYCSMSDEYYYR